MSIEKQTNSLYINTQFSLTFKTKNLSHSTSFLSKSHSNKSYISTSSLSRLTSSRKYRTASTGAINRSNNNVTNSYEHLHWKNVTSKAGIITNDSPYLSEEELQKKKYRENKKKWISKNNFNVYVGKATTNRSYIIKNYVQMTPSQPPVLYSFRPIHKDKWISKKGFIVF